MVLIAFVLERWFKNPVCLCNYMILRIFLGVCNRTVTVQKTPLTFNLKGGGDGSCYRVSSQPTHVGIIPKKLWIP